MIPARIPFPIGLAVAGLAVTACAALGGAFISRSARDWYPALPKPAWMPGGRVLGAVWTVLFALIALAAALVWGESLDVRFTSALALNLVLNVLWWWFFFAQRWPAAALADVFVLEVTCIALAALAWRISPAAGALLLPYVLWVAFAGVLNGAIVRLSPDRRRPGGQRRGRP
jgi:tryptophan-rich sensory protein